MSKPPFTARQALARAAAAVLLGYALAYAVTACLSVALPPLTGLDRASAVMAASMLSYLVYLAAILRAFAAPTAWRAAAEPAAATLGLGLTAWVVPPPG